MKRIKSLVALMTLVMAFSTCDELVPEIDSTIDEAPEPTMVGIPNGIPVSKTIGSAGGSVSIDGAVEVEIPAGALNADTEITIQSLTNNAPNGNGNAYRLGPDGTNFSKPVKLTFPYTPVVDGPPLTGIAFQDDDGIWYSNGKFSWNKIDNTVTTETTHFSDWATFDMLVVVCPLCEGAADLYKLKERESGDFKLRAITPSALDDDLVALTKRDDNAYDKIIKEWFANGELNGGSGEYGIISPTSNGCTYTAPSKAPGKSANPVSLSVTLKDLKYKDPKSGVVFNDLQVSTNVKIIGDLKYDLTVEFRDPTSVSGGLVGTTFVLSDVTTLQVLIKDDSVILSNFHNSHGIIAPNSQTDPYGNTSICTSTDFLGPLNFTEGSGIVGDFLPGKAQLWLTLEGKTETPTFDWFGATGGKVTLKSETGWFVLYPILDLTQESPYWETPGSDIVKVRLTKVE